MTADEFRRIALGFSGATEGAHMNHPDFRAAGRIFASLGMPDEEWGMIKLTPDQQEVVLRDSPTVFRPCNGAWGRQGSTNVHLASARMPEVRTALENAWQNAISQKKDKTRRPRK